MSPAKPGVSGRFSVRGDSPRQAKLRALQSWYRERVLDLPPGEYKRRLRGNHLPDLAVARGRALNLMGDVQLADYAAQRAAEVHASGGTLDADRLWGNLLSSMPLCFNIFGYLRRYPNAAAQALTASLDEARLDISEVESIDCEWAPSAENGLGDGTAFDAVVWYQTSKGERSFLAMETKYHDGFSDDIWPKPNQHRPRYRELTDKYFLPGAYDLMLDRRVNQLWRNHMLMLATSEATGRFGHLVLAACGDDEEAWDGLRTLKERLTDPDRAQSLPHEQLIWELEQIPETAERGRALRKRYFDLRPVDVPEPTRVEMPPRIPAQLLGTPPSDAPAEQTCAAWGPFIIEHETDETRHGMRLNLVQHWAGAHLEWDDGNGTLMMMGITTSPRVVADKLIVESLNHGLVVIRPVHLNDAEAFDYDGTDVAELRDIIRAQFR